MFCIGISYLKEDVRVLRKMCDDYYDSHPRVFLAGRATTNVNIDDNGYDVNRGAKLALYLYNRENQKNFNLVRVAKLNSTYAWDCMTVCAQDDEIDECHLFRCIVDVLKEEAVFCEIKCNGVISILVDNVDDYIKKLSQRDEDQPSDTWKNDLQDGLALCSDGVIYVSPTIFRIMGEKYFSDLHKMCEDYLDPCLYDKCGTMTSANVNCFDWVSEYAKLAINVYNKKEQKNFVLVKVEKLYYFVNPHYYCMTFWAQNGRSDEYRLFRAVCIKRDDEEDNKITIPAEQDDDACVQKLNESDVDRAASTCMISPKTNDLHKYLVLDDWGVDAIMDSIVAISYSRNTSDRKINDLGVCSVGGSVGTDSGCTGRSGCVEENLKY